MFITKSIFLAGFVLVSAFADSSKPAMATLQVQPNFDFSLASKEFRVHYSGLGDAYTAPPAEPVNIKIYKKEGQSSSEFHSFSVTEPMQKKAYYFALKDTTAGAYEVEVCIGTELCSGKTPALTDVSSDKILLTCNRGKKTNGVWKDSDKNPMVSLEFVGPTKQDWISESEFANIENRINGAGGSKKVQYKTDFTQLGLKTNPSYKHSVSSGKGTFYAAMTYDVAQYRQLFDKQPANDDSAEDYAHEFCERKYLLSAHAHLVNKATKEVKYRYKTTLFLSEGGKQLFVLRQGAGKVHVEMTHIDVAIEAGSYQLWITFCATEKDVIESTFCAEPIIHEKDLEVRHAAE